RLTDRIMKLPEIKTVPKIIIKTIADLDTSVTNALKDKQLKESLSATNARALGGMKNRTRKVVQQYKSQIEQYKKNPQKFLEQLKEEEEKFEEQISTTEQESIKERRKRKVVQVEEKKEEIVWTEVLVEEKLSEIM